MRCYNGCPDSELQAKLDSEAEFRKKLAKLDIYVTYFPMENKYMGFLRVKPVTEFYNSLYDAGHAAMSVL